MQNYKALKYVKDQTEEICLEAVKQNGYALQYVKEQTEAICLEAVKEDGDAFQYVEKYYQSVADIVSEKDYLDLKQEETIVLNGKTN
jgi:hypothetical protein